MLSAILYTSHIECFAQLTEDLSATQKREMVGFVQRELLTPNWMRALSVQDAAAPASDRKDHGPFGAYE